MLRILAVIPHYYHYRPGGKYGSEGAGPERKAASLRQTIQALKILFEAPQSYHNRALRQQRWQQYDAAQGKVVEQERIDQYSLHHSANDGYTAQVDILLCTDGVHTVLDRLALPEGSFRQAVMPEGGNPRHLGFFAQRVLAQQAGTYDYYCYLEDDLVVHDAEFFWKLAWFNQQFGAGKLLQPNRYEQEPDSPYFQRGYIDPDGWDNPAVAAQIPAMRYLERLADFGQEPVLELPYLGHTLRFCKAKNPHAGCFFLTADQFARYQAQPFFGVPSTEWIGPLESAATIGLVKTFAVYKPDFANGAFLEIEHADHRYLNEDIDFAGALETDSFTRAGRDAGIIARRGAVKKK